MKIPHVFRVVLFGGAVVMFGSGCATTGDDHGLSQEAVRKEVKGKPSTTFAQPLARVHDAAMRALTTVGCRIEEKQNYYVTGIRPRTFGLFAGGGGEEVDVYMLPQGDSSTEVWVDTLKSFVGLAWQRNWDKQTLDEMKSLLAK